jgi:adenylate cyclase
MVEEIITSLSRIGWLFVIARNSSFTYNGKAVDVKQVARELGVRYVLEGSVRKAGNRVRITGQLIDTSTGAHIWADRFDGALDDIFELQDQVASGVVGAIESKLRQSEIERASRKPTESLDAYDFYLRALAELHKYTEEGMRKVIDLVKRALAIDPSYAAAAALIGWCRIHWRAEGWGPLSDADVAEGVDPARQAIEMGKDDPDALWMGGQVISFLGGDHTTGAGVIGRALTLNPNSAHAWMASGYVSIFQSRPDRAIEAFENAMRLSPFDPMGYFITAGLASANLGAGRYEEALEWANRSLRELPRYIPSVRNKVVICAHLGRIEEARHLLARLLALQPDLTIAKINQYGAAVRWPPDRLALYVDGLRKAGLHDE